LPSWIVFVERLRKFRNWAPSLADAIWERSSQPSSAYYPKINRYLRYFSLVIFVVTSLTCLYALRFDYKFDEGVKIKDESAAFKASQEIFSERLKPSAIAVFSSL